MSARLKSFFELYPIFAGLIFLALGVLTFINPEVLGYYEIGVDNASARIAIRAMIGGGEVALGLVVLVGQQIGLTIQQRSLIAALVFLSVGAARFSAVWIDHDVNAIIQPLREAAFEIGLAGLGFLSVKCSR